MERALTKAPALTTHFDAATVSTVDCRDQKSSTRRHNDLPSSRRTCDQSCVNCGRRGHSARDAARTALNKSCDGCGKSSKKSDTRSHRRRSKSQVRRSGSTNAIDAYITVPQQTVNGVVTATVQIGKAASTAVQSLTSGALKTVTCRRNGRSIEL